MAPAAIVYKLMEYSLRGDIFSPGISELSLPERLLLFSPIVIVLFSALRLAEYNVNNSEEGFRGLPTPASAIYFAGGNLFLITKMGESITEFFLSPPVLLANILIISLLMISGIPMLSLKIRNFGWRGNQVRYFFLAVSGILLIILHETALPVIILFYILLSVATSLIRNDKK
jgi:CDP-diacylglycerol--serine O-phosphatidyltransferase